MTDLTTIFELVDATDEETYHSLGMYFDLESAIEDAANGDRPPTDTWDDVARLEVRERKIGFYGAHDSGKCRAQIAWLSEYNESTDEYDWKPSTKIL